MNKLITAAVIILSVALTPSAKANDPVFTVWAVTWVGVMVYDAATTGVTLPSCDKAQQENPSAYALTHGGWGNGNVNGKNLKTCKE